MGSIPDPGNFSHAFLAVRLEVWKLFLYLNEFLLLCQAVIIIFYPYLRQKMYLQR
jgi:hypothetical protein